ASMSVRQEMPMYVPGGQPGVRDFVAQDAINAMYAQGRQPPTGSYPMGAASQPYSTPNQPYGTPGQPYGAAGQQSSAPSGAPGSSAGWQQPVALIGAPASEQAGMSAPASAMAGFGTRVLLAALFGLIAAVIGALVWAFFLNIT